MAKKLTPWQRIMEAAHKGRGIRLSSDEVFDLSMDNAIETKAMNDFMDQGIWPKWAGEEPGDPTICSEGGKHNSGGRLPPTCIKCGASLVAW